MSIQESSNLDQITSRLQGLIVKNIGDRLHFFIPSTNYFTDLPDTEYPNIHTYMRVIMYSDNSFSYQEQTDSDLHNIINWRYDKEDSRKVMNILDILYSDLEYYVANQGRGLVSVTSLNLI